MNSENKTGILIFVVMLAIFAYDIYEVNRMRRLLKEICQQAVERGHAEYIVIEGPSVRWQWKESK